MSCDDLPPHIEGVMSVVSKKIGMSYAAVGKKTRKNIPKKKKRKDQNNKEYWQAYTEKKVMVHLDV